MALTNCPECGKEVSDKAQSCPNCGAPIRGEKSLNLNPKSHANVTRTGAKWEAIGFILILVGLLAAIGANGAAGGIVAFIGLIVFIIGRFL